MKLPDFEEILADKSVYFFGVGVQDAEAAFQNGTEKTTTSRVLAAIDKVITSRKHGAVGGSLQFGQFTHNDFTVYGVQETLQNAEGLLSSRMTYCGNILQDQDRDMIILGKFISRITFITPFFERERKYFDQDKVEY